MGWSREWTPQITYSLVGFVIELNVWVVKSRRCGIIFCCAGQREKRGIFLAPKLSAVGNERAPAGCNAICSIRAFHHSSATFNGNFLDGFVCTYVTTLSVRRPNH